MTTCARCGSSVGDGSVICRREAIELTELLTTAAGHAEDAEAVISRQTRYGAGARSSGDKGLSPNLAASARLAAVDRTVTGWLARLVEEGYADHWPSVWHPVEGPLCPPARPGDEERRGYRCDHDTCFAIRQRTPPPPLARRCARLAELVLAELRFHPAGGEAFAALHNACEDLARLVDRPADKDLVGVCDCGKVLYGVRGRAFVRCPMPTCKQLWHVERSREILRQHLGNKLVTAAEAAKLAAYWDERTTKQIRALIGVWVDRGQVAAHGKVWREPTEAERKADPSAEQVAEPTYRFGDVADRLARTPRRERKGAA